jgi:hypothetical protein
LGTIVVLVIKQMNEIWYKAQNILILMVNIKIHTDSGQG